MLEQVEFDLGAEEIDEFYAPREVRDVAFRFEALDRGFPGSTG